jgi:two-component system, LuxR family, response regulator FixJ
MNSTGHIHVVDDNADIRRLIALILGKKGYTVDCHDSAAAYLASSTRLSPEIMILDIRMPDMTGIQLQARLRSEGCKIPIVFISGDCSPDELLTIQNAGCVEFLWKPFGTEPLLQAVNKAFELANTHNVP